MILTLIIVIVLINFYVKKDLFLSSIIGLVLLDLFLIVTFNIAVIDISNIIDVSIIIQMTIFLIILFGFKKINDLTSFTSSKNNICDMFDNILKDKKIKLFTLMILGAIFSLVPLLGIVYLVFLAIFFRISKYNLVLAPLMSTFTFSTFYYLSSYKSSISDMNLAYKFIIFFYGALLFLVIVEKIRKIDKIVKFDFILDLIFILVMLIGNIYIYIVLINLYTVKVAILLSLSITWILSTVILNKFNTFINKEHKEVINTKYENNFFNKLRLPYLTLLLVVITQMIGFVLCIFNFYIGGIYLICSNFIFIKKIQHPGSYKREISIIKIIIFIFVLYSNVVILDSIMNFTLDMVINVLNNNIIYLDTPFKFLLNSQNFILFPDIGWIDNYLNGETIANIINLKILLILKVQLTFSLIVLLIIEFIFSFKKNEIIQITTLVIATSIILQLIIYLY